MKCPNCRNEMIKGVAEVLGAAPGFLPFGLPRQHLWFSAPRKERIRVVTAGVPCAAWHCELCDSTTIAGRDEKEPGFQQILAVSENRT